MSDNIFGQRFISRELPAWYKLGKVFEKSRVILASEAAAEVAGDVVVEAFPVKAELPDGTLLLLDDTKAILRKPTADCPKYEKLGVTTDQWTPDSYVSLARGLDELSRRYKVETAGTLNQGGLFFLSLRAEDWEIQKDAYRSYFVCNLSLTPGKGHRVFHSPVRVVCWNTNTQAMSESTINLSVPHSADAQAKIAFAGTCVARFKEMQAKTKEVFEAMTKVKATPELLDKVFSAAFPEPPMPARLRMIKAAVGGADQAALLRQALSGKDLEALTRDQESWDRALDRTHALRRVCGDRFEAFEPGHLRGTVYAAYNAVTEVSDWREGRGADVSSMWGSRANEKARAFSAAVSVLN